MTKAATTTEAKVEALFKLGAHFGYTRSRRHPSTDPFIYGFKNRTAVIDLEKALTSLDQAKAFLSELGASQKTVLWVGTKSEAKSAVQAIATSLNHPYVNSRWIGGTMTNWTEIRKRLERMIDLEEKQKANQFTMYTKRERLMIDKEIANLQRYFDTVRSLTKLPDAIVTVDAREEGIAMHEAKVAHVPVISISGTDSNLNGVAYPVVVNDGSKATIAFCLEELAAAYRAGSSTVPTK